MKLKNCDFSVIFATNIDVTNLIELNTILKKKLGWSNSTIFELFSFVKKYLLVGASGMLWTGQWVRQ